ncbi:MAG: hypothetical protein AAF242_15545, partial [Bacteroidota bacterium]
MWYYKLVFLGLVLTTISCRDRAINIEVWGNGKPKKKWEIHIGKTFETNFYENGNIESLGLLIDDLQVKEWRFYHENGTLRKIVSFRQGKPIGISKTYYDDGIQKSIEEYDDYGQKTGQAIYYSKGGRISQKGKYDSGFKVDQWSYYNASSQVEEEAY